MKKYMPIAWFTLVLVLLFGVISYIESATFTRCTKSYGGTVFRDGVATTAADFNCDVDGLVTAVNNVESTQIVNGTIVDADIAPSGITTRAKLPSAIAYEDEVNTFALGTITTDQPIFNGTATWNAGGVTFNGIKTNITDTASASASNLMNLQVGGVSKISVDKSGNASIAGTYGSSKACPTNYTRGSNNDCVRTDTTGAAQTVTTTCSALTFQTTAGSVNLPSTAKIVRTEVDLDLYSGTATGGESVMVEFYSDSACITRLGGDTQVRQPRFIGFSDITTAGTKIAGDRQWVNLYVNGQATVYAKKVEALVTGGSTTADVLSTPTFYFE